MAALGNVVFNNIDMFAEADESKQTKENAKQSFVHIRTQQRTTRKYITTVEGLAEDLDLARILKALKKTYNTNGAILKDEEGREVLQLNGDQRKNVYEFFVKYKVCDKSEIKVHGA
jgi:translation initiation factor 1